MVAEPPPLSVKLIALGSVPVSLRLGGGVPVVVTGKELDTPAVNVTLLLLVIVGGVPTTLMLAVAVFPVPPSFEVTAPVVLFFMPVVVAVTLTEIAQELLPATVPPDKVIDPDPATAVVVPPQVVLSPLGVATTNPAGRTSVNATPVRLFELELLMVKVRLVVVFRLI